MGEGNENISEVVSSPTTFGTLRWSFKLKQNITASCMGDENPEIFEFS